ncbi:extracellular solute-binding protein [Seminavis robusta]|uniref:Extracellular solute-binding protein n=1 Tax=Seminavis robusta TaxID=568900 RepID=A0A9N8DS35_9STRA|nr:extracellular solute-binding protein [Seminavis robusta]|eukprot:Sro328_g118720.1 extracellular solute-binding protein (784) ;mRNA; r:61889-64646
MSDSNEESFECLGTLAAGSAENVQGTGTTAVEENQPSQSKQQQTVEAASREDDCNDGSDIPNDVSQKIVCARFDNGAQKVRLEGVEETSGVPNGSSNNSPERNEKNGGIEAARQPSQPGAYTHSLTWRARHSTRQCLVSAYAVDDEHPSTLDIEEQRAQIEQEVISRLLGESGTVQADAVVMPDEKVSTKDGGDNNNNNNKRASLRAGAIYVSIFVAVIVVVVVVIVLATTGTYQNHEGSDTSPPGVTNTSPSTLAIIRDRGFVRCGVYPAIYGWNRDLSDGLSHDSCKALSVAVFGTPDKVEMVAERASWGNLFTLLANHTVDVITDVTTHNMGRDVFHRESKTPFAFSRVVFYGGGVFAGVPTFVDCAEKLDTLYGLCRDLKICAFFGSVSESLMWELLPGSPLVPIEAVHSVHHDIASKLTANLCNVIFTNSLTLVEASVREMGYEGPYRVGTKFFARSHAGLMTRDDDPGWSNLVDLIIGTLFTAEAFNISNGNADDIALYLPNNTEMASIMTSVVRKVGNYGDVYRRNLGPFVPRQGLNAIYGNNSNSGLLYAHTFRELDVLGRDPIPGMTLHSVMERGMLRCGVHPRLGFAAQDEGGWVGLDVQFCNAVATAIFGGDSMRVEFINLQGNANGAYSSLSSGDVDLVAGSRVSLQADYHEPTTARGYSFSRPYFYNNSNMDAFALMTTDDDTQWNEFVFWTVVAVIYAEENDISHETAIEMPVVSLFGDSLKQMFRDCVTAVGSYATMYNTTLEQIIPRAGANRLNDQDDPEHFPVPFA